jgi:hypothetical protein
MLRKLILALIVLGTAGCGTSQTMVTSKYEELESWQLCKKQLEGTMASWKVPWANKVLKARGDSCEKYFGKFRPQADESLDLNIDIND